MIDWKCSKCGFKPGLITPAAYDGWFRFEISTARADRVTRQAVYTLDSLDCVLEVLTELELSARQMRQANEVDEVDELRAKVDGVEEAANYAATHEMNIGEEIVFEGPGYRHVLRKTGDVDEPDEPV